jgi:septal ring factor EnvC (AmiA/AmiB activator)
LPKTPEGEFELSLGNGALISLFLFFVLTAIALFLFGARVGHQSSIPAEATKSDYLAQVKSLDNAKTALESLTAYIDQQKKQLEESRNSLAALQEQENKMQPLVQADKRVINSLFAVQEERNQTAQSRERWIGFGLGVLASLIASLIYTIGNRLSKRRIAGISS